MMFLEEVMILDFEYGGNRNADPTRLWPIRVTGCTVDLNLSDRMLSSVASILSLTFEILCRVPNVIWHVCPIPFETPKTKGTKTTAHLNTDT
jgi:hypothetical protein